MAPINYRLLAVLRSDRCGQPIEITVAIDEVDVPLDIGILFAKVTVETTYETTSVPTETSTYLSHTISTGTMNPPESDPVVTDTEDGEAVDIEAGEHPLIIISSAAVNPFLLMQYVNNQK